MSKGLLFQLSVHPIQAILSVTLLAFTPVQAQEIEEVVIQAEQVENQLLNDMVSASSLDAEKLADAGIENVEDVAAYVPNLVLTQTETGTNIFIRGIGAGTNQGFDQSVGLYSDGVPLPRGNMARAPFLDLASVQVLRGPQYVLDGNYSIAGSVHMLSNLAQDEFKSGINLKYIPSFDDQTLLLTAGGPINDSFAINTVLQRKKSDGFIENVTRDEDGPARDELLGRMVLGWNPTDDLSFKLKLEKGRFDTTGRAAEVIFAGASPKLERQFSGQDAVNLSRQFGVATDDLDFSKTVYRDGRRADINQYATVTYTPDEYAYVARNTQYDRWPVPKAENPHQAVFPFSGQTYFETFQRFYTGTTFDNKVIPTDGLANFATQSEREAIFYQNGTATLPAGFLDTSANFKRGADADEFSNNDSLNITLNSNFWMGEYEISATAAYIEYEFDELIDADFTALPLLESIQSEEYSQDYYAFQIKSPDDGFMMWTLGFSYLQSELSFNDRVTPNWNISGTSSYSFDASQPLSSYLGTVLSPEVLTIVSQFSPDRQFDQDTAITAAYFQSTFHWSDEFRTVIGARYTHAEKDATRDLALVERSSGGIPVLIDDPNAPGKKAVSLANGDIIPIGAFVTATDNVYGSFFGIQPHTDRYGADLIAAMKLEGSAVASAQTTTKDIGGTRREETLLPSITLEWDASEDITIRASARMANKLGGFDARSNSTPNAPAVKAIPVGTFEFEDEDATTYELGMRWFLPNDLGELTATAFYTDFRNLQLSRADGRGGSNVFNAGAATTMGLEIEGYALITDKFNINYSMAYTKFEYTEFKLGGCYLGRRPDYKLANSLADTGLNALIKSNTIVSSSGYTFAGFGFADGIVPILYPDTNPEVYRRLEKTDDIKLASEKSLLVDANGNQTNTKFLTTRESLLLEIQAFDTQLLQSSPEFCDFEGQTNQFVADFQGTFSFNYETEVIGMGLLKPTLDVLYNSGYATNSLQDPDVAQDAYFQFNGRIAVSDFDGIWEVALIGQNLTNQKIVSYSQDLAVANGIQGAKSYWGILRPPRSIGLNFTYNFY